MEQPKPLLSDATNAVALMREYGIAANTKASLPGVAVALSVFRGHYESVWYARQAFGDSSMKLKTLADWLLKLRDLCALGVSLTEPITFTAQCSTIQRELLMPSSWIGLTLNPSSFTLFFWAFF